MLQKLLHLINRLVIIRHHLGEQSLAYNSGLLEAVLRLTWITNKGAESFQEVINVRTEASFTSDLEGILIITVFSVVIVLRV